MLKHLPAMQETQVLPLGQEDPLEKEMATHFSYSCLENSMDKGAWQATVHRVTELDMTEQLTHTQILMAGQYIPHLQGFAKLLEPSLYIN